MGMRMPETSWVVFERRAINLKDWCIWLVGLFESRYCFHVPQWQIIRMFVKYICIFFLWRCGPTRIMASSFLRFLDHTQRRTTFGRTPLDEWSAPHRDLYLTTHNTHNRQTSMNPGGIRTHDPSRRAAADLRLRPRGHSDRLVKHTLPKIWSSNMTTKIISVSFPAPKWQLSNSSVMKSEVVCLCIPGCF